MFPTLSSQCRHEVLCWHAAIVPRRVSSSFSSVDGICWTPHSGSGRPAWITQQAAVAPLRRAQKAEGKMLCYNITSSSNTPSWHSVFNKSHAFLHFVFFSTNSIRKGARAATARLVKNEYANLFQKLHASVCINTKPSVSRRANASMLASSFQSNCVGEISKYVIYEPESRRRLLIKYAKLYLSTEVWICSGVQPSNHTKGGGMFLCNLPSHCNSSFPPLSNYSWLAV